MYIEIIKTEDDTLKKSYTYNFQIIFTPQKSGSQEDNHISNSGCPHSFFGRRGHANFATLSNLIEINNHGYSNVFER